MGHPLTDKLKRVASTRHQNVVGDSPGGHNSEILQHSKCKHG